MDLLNLPHLHLLLNHVPTIGTVVGLGLLLLSLVRKNDDLRRASLEVFFLIALLSLPAYLSGNAALKVIEGRPDVSAAFVAAHQDEAVLALVFMEITGLVAWFGLWQMRRNHPRQAARWNLPAVLVLAVLTLALMAKTATLGGEIRHEEIRTTQEIAAATGAEAGWFTSTSIAAWVNRVPWVWPASETLHFMGLCLLFGVVLIVNLRMLGFMKSLAFVDVRRLLPLGMVGFGINLVTGMLFFISTPGQYAENVAFYWKMLLVLLGGAHVLYLTVFDQPWTVGPGDDPPLTAKVLAGSAIFIWVGVLYFGRMLPYIGNAF